MPAVFAHGPQRSLCDLFRFGRNADSHVEIPANHTDAETVSLQGGIETGHSRAFGFSQLQPLNLSLRLGMLLALVIAGDGTDRQSYE